MIPLFQPRKQHWEKIYQTKKSDEVSWYKPVPKTSLDLILSLRPAPQTAIIDVGGGDSVLADKLLALNFKNITVLDISAQALQRAQQRLGSQAQSVQWITADILDFDTEKRFDIWHDWAALGRSCDAIPKKTKFLICAFAEKDIMKQESPDFN